MAAEPRLSVERDTERGAGVVPSPPLPEQNLFAKNTLARITGPIFHRYVVYTP